MSHALHAVQAIAADHDSKIAAALHQQAFRLHEQGHIEAAARLYQHVLRLQPQHFDALHLLGVAALQCDQPQLAVDLIGQALQINQRNAAAYVNQGLALHVLHHNDAALTSYEQALTIEPDNLDALNNHGDLLRELGRYEDALASYKRILVLDVQHTSALDNIGGTLHHLQRYKEALAYYDRMLALHPEHLEAMSNRGVVLLALSRYNDALASFDRVLDRSPDHAAAHYNRGNVLRALNRHEEAVASYDQVLLLHPDNAEVLNNRGNALRALNRLQEALASYEHALLKERDYADAQWNSSLCRLLAGDFAIGWQQYEWRWKSEFKHAKRNFPQALWLGLESLQGRTILLHAEQGLGDTLQFCRYAIPLKALGANVILEVQPALKKLLAGLLGIKAIFARGEPLPPFDFHCPLLSLPLALGADLHSIPDVPYITADPYSVSRWKQTLDPKPLPNIGLVWSGNPLHSNDHNRSIPLIELMPVVNPQANFYALQKAVPAHDALLLKSHPEVVLLEEYLQDFTDTAAIIELMDIVITVDTAVAHLAGAMGKTVWILLPFSPDWRWLLERVDSPWYPTARLYRQAALDDWRNVVQQVSQELQSFTALYNHTVSTD